MERRVTTDTQSVHSKRKIAEKEDITSQHFIEITCSL